MLSLKIKTGVVILFFVWTNGLMAQSALLEQANHSFNQGEWEEAVSHFEKHLKTSPSDSLAYFNVGVAHYNLEQFEKSLIALEKAKSSNFNPIRVAYNKARAYAKLNRQKEAFITLEDATTNGLPVFKQLQSEPAFKAYQEHPQFIKIVEQARKNAYPCLTNPECRKFDFWLGEWDVYVGPNKVGENLITLGEGGCAIHETYTTPSGFAGQSINYYDNEGEKWRQNWVGSAYPNILKFEEIGSEKGKIIFQDEITNPTTGNPQLVKMTFTHDPEKDTVVQYMETSNDSGENWSPAFNGLYVKKGKDPGF